MKSKVRVLLADDHKIMRDGILLVLSKIDYIEVVGEASDGNSAIAIAKEIQPDVVLMDINMPNKNGIAATSEILMHFPEIRIVALTGHTESPMVQEMFRAGAMAFLGKECSNKEIIKAIDSVMAGLYYISEELTGNVIENFVVSQIPKINEVSEKLTSREKEVLIKIAEGRSTKAIADELNLSSKTVGAHRENLMKKLDIHNIAQLTRYAIQRGLISLHE